MRPLFGINPEKKLPEMKKIVLILLLLPLFSPLWAQDFEQHFADETLRLDYTFAGNAEVQIVALKELQRYPLWAGRRVNLDSVPLLGNGDLTLKDPTTDQPLYKCSFSSLFQEWITTPEAEGAYRSFEFTILVPRPLQPIIAEIVLRDNEGQEQCRLRHLIRPDDVLIRDRSSEEPAPHQYLHQGGDPREVIDVAILAEGYTEQEMGLFLQDAQTAAEEILRYEPFARYRDRFNFVAVCSSSEDSGVSVPDEGVWCETAVGSNFMTFYMPRYLTTNRVHQLYDRVKNIPCEHLIVLANTETYGGGGIYNSYTLTTAHHLHFRPVVVHEFGHSFGGLGDEYFYENQTSQDETHSLKHEPWEPNITTLVDFSSKWGYLIPAEVEQPTTPTEERKAAYTVGLYEGGGYRTRGVYRPAVVCRMRDNQADRFCPVCERALERVIRHQTEAEKE